MQHREKDARGQKRATRGVPNERLRGKFRNNHASKES